MGTREKVNACKGFRAFGKPTTETRLHAPKRRALPISALPKCLRTHPDRYYDILSRHILYHNQWKNSRCFEKYIKHFKIWENFGYNWISELKTAIKKKNKGSNGKKKIKITCILLFCVI